jgi:hypothetical protein
MRTGTTAVIAFAFALICDGAAANCDPAQGAVDIDTCLIKGRTAIHGKWQVLGLREWQKNGDIQVSGRSFSWGRCRQIPAQVTKRGEGKFLLILLDGKTCDLSGWSFKSIEFRLANETYLTFFEDPAGNIAVPVKSPQVIRRDEWRP